MVTTLLRALSGEKLLHQSSVGAVTTNCVVFRAIRAPQTYLLSLSSPAKIKKVTTTYPGLLIVSLGLFTLSAADYCSPHRGQAYVPLAVIGAGFSAAYFLTRRAALVFVYGSEMIFTRCGSLREIAGMSRAIEQDGSFGASGTAQSVIDAEQEVSQLTAPL